MRRGIQAALLIISAIGFYLIYKSIQTPIEFARESKARFAKVIATLKDIRKSEEAYEAINKTYTNNFADLFLGDHHARPFAIFSMIGKLNRI